MVNPAYITTSTHIEGHSIRHQLGIVCGITVRSRNIFSNIAGSFMTLFGGRNTIYTQLCESTRKEAMSLMVKQAEALGANGIIAFRYDATEVMQGLTEVLAYGTAVIVD